uniref:Uncharacterized protein n=1 Tax=Anguilla anguilla TaxID=7936 RepID=A0A0E9S808_ANGAN
MVLCHLVTERGNTWEASSNETQHYKYLDVHFSNLV